MSISPPWTNRAAKRWLPDFMMLSKIADFEVRYQLRNPVFWVCSTLFFLFAFGAVASSDIVLGGANTAYHRNGPYQIQTMQMVLAVLYTFVTTAFVANAVVRDEESGMAPLVRTTGLARTSYVIGRFVGAFVVCAIGFLAVPIGQALAAQMPWIDPEFLGPNRVAFYLFPYVFIVLPALLVTSALFFAVATATRSMMASYVAVLAFLLLWGTSKTVMQGNPDLRTLTALTDPFGYTALSLVQRYWTVADANTRLAPLTGVWLASRAIWFGVAGLVLAITTWRFRFAERGLSVRKAARQARREATLASRPPARVSRLPHSSARGTALPRLVAQARFEAGLIVRSPAFFVLLAVGMLNAVAGMLLGSQTYGVKAYPATFLLIEVLRGAFVIAPAVIAGFYAGELVWRDRDRRIHEIVDASAMPAWALLLPKLLALVGVLAAVHVSGIMGAMVVQLAKGFTAIHPGEYFAWFLLTGTADMVLLGGLALLLQVLAPNKYVGWGLLLVYFVVLAVLSPLGFQHPLYTYGTTGPTPLSDMNGAHAGWSPGWALRAYWGLILVAMMALAQLLWRRGTETRLVPRLRQARRGLRGPVGAVLALALLAAGSLGGWLWWQMDVVSPYRTSKDDERARAEFEKRYYRFATAPEPSATAIRLNVDLYPRAMRMEARGSYELVNRTGVPIGEMHLVLPERSRDILALDVSGAHLELADDERRFRTYRFDKPLAPGARSTMTFHVRRWQRGIRAEGDDTRLVANGTFLNSMEIAPTVGVHRDVLLQDPGTRRKYGLPSQLRMARLEDRAATQRNYLGNADWVSSDITLSTEADQIGIAPGDKISETVALGRRTARFVAKGPILNFWSIQSARYAVAERMNDGVRLSVYYDPKHAYNVQRMLDAFGSALPYYRANFGPYQFDYARIVEFPGYASFAQAFAGTMPYSESIGFLGDFSKPDRIDYATYVAAHELAHQYWGHQMISADQQGGTLMVETLAQYSALMVMKHRYGEDKIRRFLRYELDSYLRARGGEAIAELPLSRVENQPYIHYRKGAVVFYLLQDRLGEERVNAMLRAILARHRFGGAPFVSSTELVSGFHDLARSPAEQELVTDLLERITLYDFKTVSATSRRLPDGRWETAVNVSARKLRADGKGRETEVPLKEAVEIGLFSDRPGEVAFGKANVLLRERHEVRSGEQTILITTQKKPAFAGIDPYNTFIDRDSDDNIARVS